MRRLVVLALSAAIAFTAVDAVEPRQADAACFTDRCFNRQIKRLKRQVRALRITVFGCERLVPVTQYQGYEYGGTGAQTTALDITEDGDQVGAWFVIDICQTASVATTQAGRSLGAIPRAPAELGAPRRK
jgi:hypothetical protein